MTRIRLPYLLLGTSCLIYGLFGAPTPAHTGLAELAIAIILICLTLLANGLRIFNITNRQITLELWEGSGLLFVIYCLCVPVLLGCLYGHGIVNMTRDLIGICFLIIPLLLSHYFRHHCPISNNRAKTASIKAESVISAILTMTGLLFAGRFIYSIYRVDPTLTFGTTIAESHHIDMTLANAPSILFAGIYLMCRALQVLGKSLKSQITCLIWGALSIIPVLSAILALQRAFLSAMALSVIMTIFVSGFLSGTKSPYKTGGVILSCAFLVFLLLPEIIFVTHAVTEKTKLVGLNRRIDEIMAVSNYLGSIPFGHYLGGGWGTIFLSPAAGHKYVSYTHNLFSGLWLKSGIIGVILAGGFVFSLSRSLVTSAFWRKDAVTWCALFFPFVINLFFYANHKSFDFGLILLLISIYGARYSTLSGHTLTHKGPFNPA